MENCLQIGKVNLKFNLSWHIVAAVCFCLISPLLMGTSALDSARVAQLIESYVVLAGIILLIPIFVPDQDKNIRDLTSSKYVSVTTVHVIRLAEAMAALLILLFVYIFWLSFQSPGFPLGVYYAGAVADAVFLGGIGLLTYALSDNLPAAYMIPVFYYVANYSGSKYLGKFYLFSMSGGGFEEKIWMGVSGVLCMGIGILIRRKRRAS